jgi:predicted RNA-binding protein
VIQFLRVLAEENLLVFAHETAVSRITDSQFAAPRRRIATFRQTGQLVMDDHLMTRPDTRTVENTGRERRYKTAARLPSKGHDL